MTKITRPKSEDRFAAAEKRLQTILLENKEAAEVSRQKSAKLKALRLLRDAENLQV